MRVWRRPSARPRRRNAAHQRRRLHKAAAPRRSDLAPRTRPRHRWTHKSRVAALPSRMGRRRRCGVRGDPRRNIRVVVDAQSSGDRVMTGSMPVLWAGHGRHRRGTLDGGVFLCSPRPQRASAFAPPPPPPGNTRNAHTHGAQNALQPPPPATQHPCCLLNAGALAVLTSAGGSLRRRAAPRLRGRSPPPQVSPSLPRRPLTVSTGRMARRRPRAQAG